jgi:type I restriction enzyme R subunit
MSNFDYLEQLKLTQLHGFCVKAEQFQASYPEVSVTYARRALEYLVKALYVMRKITLPARSSLYGLVEGEEFKDFISDNRTMMAIHYVRQIGSRGAHGEKISVRESYLCLTKIYNIVTAVLVKLKAVPEVRPFNRDLIPAAPVIPAAVPAPAETVQVSPEDPIVKGTAPEVLSDTTPVQDIHGDSDLTEAETRKLYIDLMLREAGWKFEGVDADVLEEYEVTGMNGVAGQQGFVDYVLMGRNGYPLAVIEAKRTSKDPNIGRTQAKLYADCLERKFGHRPMMFTCNGFETYFWDDTVSPQRSVSGFFTKSDLEKLMTRRGMRQDLSTIKIDEKITDRYYQMEAIRAVCEHLGKGFRKALLVMATGTGKTRTASSLTDVLSRGGHITNVLFLADRTALVKQAKDDFKNYLPDMSLCNLCGNQDDRNARIVFSTYPTLLNAIDKTRTKDGIPLFSPAHFDLIIIDEAHRSIFKKYRAIFEYFDAILVGLTATPKTDVDRNTYDFFEAENGMPTYAYDYETAVNADHVLVPYYNYVVTTKFLEEGITYDELSDEDKKRYEDDFAEDGYIPEFIPSEALNRFVFNEETVDTVLEDLMERGIKVHGGDRLGKTIVFAQNKRHAEFIVNRFNRLYPWYKGKFAQRVTCEDNYAQTVIDKFKIPDAMPVIAVSVDMMDTGIDVPECVNLVFFKKVRSKTKFWQMIGRGTRLCKNLRCIDGIDGEYQDKCRFMIFDYCGNFEYFRENKNGKEMKEVMTLSESIYCKQIRLIHGLQESAFAGEEYQAFRRGLTDICHQGVCDLSYELMAVRLKRKYVEKFKERSSFDTLSEMDKSDLIKQIAPLISSRDTDEFAKRFDNFMYGMMLANMEDLPQMRHLKEELRATVGQLETKANIPQVQQKMGLIKEIQTDDFWEDISILTLENVRSELRGLMQFLVGNDRMPNIFTRLEDPVLERQEGITLEAAYDFEDYRKKVNRYVEEHKNDPVIYKLNHNEPLTQDDYNELERIFTRELGNQEDYKREFKDTPFGLLVRKIAKLDHDSVMKAFASFINDQSLNQEQINFIHKIINHIENNGYIEDMRILREPPFDRPHKFIHLFSIENQRTIVETIEKIKKNALVA